MFKDPIQVAINYFLEEGTTFYFKGIFKPTKEGKQILSFSDFLNSFGLTKEDYLEFLTRLAKMGKNIHYLANSLKIPEKQIAHLVPDDDEVNMNMDITLNNGDRVIFIEYKPFTQPQTYRYFITAFLPETKNFIFISTQKPLGHSVLFNSLAEILQEPNDEKIKIIEGGFLGIDNISQKIELYDKSESFRVFPGLISKNLLTRALRPKGWIIKV